LTLRLEESFRLAKLQKKVGKSKVAKRGYSIRDSRGEDTLVVNTKKQYELHNHSIRAYSCPDINEFNERKRERQKEQFGKNRKSKMLKLEQLSNRKEMERETYSPHKTFKAYVKFVKEMKN
jgi:hypothetical protein